MVRRDSRDVGPRELISNYIVFSADAMHVGGKLADEKQVVSLTRKTLSNTGEGESEGLMISEDSELAALNVVVKVLDRKEDGQLFAIESPVLSLSIGEFPGKKIHTVPDTVEKLLKLATDCPVGNIHRDAGPGVQVRVLD